MRRHHERGIASIWTVMMVMMLFAFFALAVDVLWVVVAARQLSAGADASSLAGVALVRRDQSQARDQAVTFAAANFAANDSILISRNDGNDPAGNVVIGRWSRDDNTFTPLGLGEGLPNAMRVVAPRTDAALGGPLPSLMASTFGINSFDVERRATAMIMGDIGPGVLILDPFASCAMDMRGNIDITILNAAVVVNSEHATAACHSGQPTLNTEELYVVGGLDGGFESQVDTDASIYTGADPVPDPLADLPEPNAPTINHGNQIFESGNVTLQPGRYGNLTIQGTANVTFQPGLYYMTGEFKHNGGIVNANAGVMLFIAPGGRINVAGNGTFQIRPILPLVYPNGPSVPGSVANIGVPIFQSRSNTTTAEINGTNDWLCDGTIYIPNAELLARGTPGPFATGLVVGRLDVRGTVALQIDYQDQFPRIPRRVFLVE